MPFHFRRILLVLVVAILAVGCATNNQHPSAKPEAATAVAETVEAAHIAGAVRATLTAAVQTQPLPATQAPSQPTQPTSASTPAATRTPVSIDTATPTPTPTPAADAIVNTRALNVRQGPGTHYPVLGVVKAGAELTILGKNRDDSWLQVRTTEIDRGWVFAGLVQIYVDLNSVAVAQAPPAPTLAPAPAPTAAQASERSTPRLVLANYFPWYDADKWDACNVSAGDKPLQLYSSDDPAAIARHIRMALDVGLDGFTSHWFVPGERTDRNFAALLAQSQGADFHSTIVFSRHFWPGSPAPTQQNVADAIRYVIDRYGGHPNFLRLAGKPVIFFTDMYRVPAGAGQSPQQAWAAIRAQVDPNHNTWWIAEGLDPAYLSVFDGLYVYKITHADYPTDYVKASRWGAGVRRWEERTGEPKLWIATLSPGWDDLRAGCRPDVRTPSKPHKQDRDNGAFYRATFDAALESNPDWLWIHSFNEWVEGTYVEPSVLYSDRYMQLTREFVQRFKR